MSFPKNPVKLMNTSSHFKKHLQRTRINPTARVAKPKLFQVIDLQPTEQVQ
jgi:hypothetical protein